NSGKYFGWVHSGWSFVFSCSTPGICQSSISEQPQNLL
ncbi:hypothetical protein AVEN_170651-1, partial [Araneus ventricosus]